MKATLLIVLLLACAGCGGERLPAGLVSPWRETDTPDDLALLADDLLAYRAINSGRLPELLRLLDESGLATGGPWGERAFAYHPNGIGILAEGWRLILVDDRLREPKHAWCIVRPPVRIGSSRSLRVALVPLQELQIAGANAAGAP
jgi:hypothetical protein